MIKYSKDKFYIDAYHFLIHLFDEIEKNNIELKKHWNIDHLCYRTKTTEEYQSFKKYFSEFGQLLIESDLNGRMISTFKLQDAVQFKDWVIDVVELPAPKVGKETETGFEHIEVVCDIEFEEIKEKYKSCNYDEGGLQKEFNKELEIKLSNCALKFHHISLESVINLERNYKVFSALKKLTILRSLNQFNPLVVGTFPLDLHTQESDVDIILSHHDLSELKTKIQNHFSNLDHFSIQEYLQNNEQIVVSNFTFENIQFELFAQKIQSVRQAANLHFLIEERLLKLGGKALKEKVLRARNSGDKTEPAFAKILQLNGDPYESLLKLQNMTEAQLKEVLTTPH